MRRTPSQSAQTRNFIAWHTWWWTVLQKWPGLRRSQRPISASAKLPTSDPKLTMMFNLFWEVRVSTHSLSTGSQVDIGPYKAVSSSITSKRGYICLLLSTLKRVIYRQLQQTRDIMTRPFTPYQESNVDSVKTNRDGCDEPVSIPYRDSIQSRTINDLSLRGLVFYAHVRIMIKKGDAAREV